MLYLPPIATNNPQSLDADGAIRSNGFLRNTKVTGAENEDLVLLTLVARADAAALGKLYDKYQRKIYSLVLRILRNEEDAGEILQDVFLQVWEKAELFDRDRGSFSTWLATLAHNKAINLLRSKRAKKQSLEVNHDREEIAEISSDLMIEHRTALDEQIETGEREVMLSLLSKLTEDQRTALIMAYYNGYSQTEIADSLGVPLGTVKTRMRQGMIKLRELVHERQLSTF